MTAIRRAEIGKNTRKAFYVFHFPQHSEMREQNMLAVKPDKTVLEL